MAKESGLELQKIELKVSVNCCDGCKKKVKKALQSVEGVLKIEVDPMQPKVTVVGNVDPQILVKRLSKVSKHAEVQRCCKQNSEPMKNSGEVMPKDKEKCSRTDESPREHQQQHQQQQEKPSSDTTKGNQTRKDENGVTDKSSQRKEETSPEVKIKIGFGNPNPFATHPEMTGYRVADMVGDVSSYNAQYAVPVPIPCYAVPSYAYAAVAPPPAAVPLHQPLPQSQTCCSQEYYHRQPPLFQAPATRVGDYFSDENTVGCSIM